jgi:Na+/melibiose symporter-like transporter
MAAFVISSIIAGQIVGKFGRYWPFLLLGPIPIAVGAGVMYTIKASSSLGEMIGLQIIVRIGSFLFFCFVLILEVIHFFARSDWDLEQQHKMHNLRCSELCFLFS